MLRLLTQKKVEHDDYVRLDTELRDRHRIVLQQIETAGQRESERADDIVDTFELSQRLTEKWLAADAAAKRQILEIVGLNWTLSGRILDCALRKPFDALLGSATMAIYESGRADWI